ncbi:MAG: energy transducer TonB [Croceibacterium sp.]
MLLIVLAALASVATRPEPQGNQAQWIEVSDIPESEWTHATFTSYDLTLDKTGRLIRCEITQPSASKIMDDVVCASLMRRARYRPALDASGVPVPSIVRDHVRWVPDGNGQNEAQPKAPDIVIRLDKSLLKKKAASVQVIEIIEPSGQIESCGPEKGQSEIALAEAACGVVKRPEVALLVRDETGAPVRGVRAFNVAYVVDPKASIVIR